MWSLLNKLKLYLRFILVVFGSNNRIIPGFVVADILIGNIVNENQIEFFINKIKALKFQRNPTNFIPFLIVEWIDTKSLNTLKA